MKTKRIAINGFGRIGRAGLKVIMNIPELEVVAVNDIMSIDNAAYLFRYDSVYGKIGKEVKVEGDHLIVGDRKIQFLTERDTAKLPWKKLEIDVEIERTAF